MRTLQILPDSRVDAEHLNYTNKRPTFAAALLLLAECVCRRCSKTGRPEKEQQEK